jgi:hypothetical protein
MSVPTRSDHDPPEATASVADPPAPGERAKPKPIETRNVDDP